MNRVIFSLSIFMIFLNCGFAQGFQNVDAVRFKELIEKGNVIILDVRTPQEFSRGHISGSTLININDPEFVSKTNMLQKNKSVLLYCLTGSRSAAAASYLVNNGFKSVFNLQRGILDWNRQGYEFVLNNETIASKSIVYNEESFTQLLKNNKLVLIDFHAIWCAPCKAMEPIVDKISNDFKGKVKVEKIDVDANKPITTLNQVQSVPGFVLFKEGKKVWSNSGVLSYDEIAAVIKKY